MKNQSVLRISTILFFISFMGCTQSKNASTESIEKVKATNSAKVESEKSKIKKKQLYTCPMHPQIITEKPGQCPICHMDLVPIERHDHEEEITGKESDKVEGRAGFDLSNEKQQLIGIAVTKVKYEDLTKEIRATGKVAYDPELYTAFEEYRQAVLSYESMGSDTLESMKSHAKSMVNSAKTKLKLMGLSDDKIKSLLRHQDDSMNFVLPKGKAWIYAEVFENELAGVKVGQEIEATAPSITDETYKGIISSINPVLNVASRTVRVKAEVNDPKEKLRPDTFVNVKISIRFGKKLVVPEDAVLFSMGKSFVFLEKEKGKYEPVVVETGEKGTHSYEIRKGLTEGQLVVTSANFLMDSESRLKGVLKKAVDAGVAQ